jgi:hypothetical protein
MATNGDGQGTPRTLLLDSRSRALLRRTDPYEVREAYVWAARVAAHPMFKDKAIDTNRFVALAPLAALVREETDLPLGKSLKRAGINERHVRRLLSADREGINEQLEKMLRLLKKKADIADLVAVSLYWGDRTVRRIAMDFFGVDQGDSETGAPA